MNWQRTQLAVVACVIALVFPLAAQQTGFTSADLHTLKSVGDVQLSPDGRSILYSLTSREGLGRSSSRLWMYDLATESARQLLESAGSSARWSPDGMQIAYTGELNSQSGLIVMRSDGSNPRFLAEVTGTNHPLPSSGERFTWAPDGSAIAFVSTTPGPESAEASGDPVVITRYLYKPTASEGLTRFNDNCRAHIFVVDVSSGDVRQLTDGVYYEHSLDWSPDGSEILFISNRESDPDRFFNYDIFAVRVDNGSIRRLTQTENAEYRPRWSPDGSRIVYQGTRRGLTSSETTMEDTHVWVMNADGSGRRELGEGIDNRQGAPQWSRDGRSVFFTVQESGSVGLHALDVDGRNHAVLLGEPGGVGNWSVSRDGTIAYAFHSAGDLAQLFVRDSRGTRQLTDVNRNLLDNRFVGEMESLRFQSFDGVEVEAFFTYPMGLSEGSSHP